MEELSANSPQPTRSRSCYLVWSHEHSAWWKPGMRGYTRSLSEAGRYTVAEALDICTKAIPGEAHRLGALPELPVHVDMLAFMVAEYQARFPNDRLDWMKL